MDPPGDRRGSGPLAYIGVSAGLFALSGLSVAAHIGSASAAAALFPLSAAAGAALGWLRA